MAKYHRKSLDISKAREPQSPFAVHMGVTCILCAHRNNNSESTPAPKYGKGQRICTDTEACRERRAK